MNAFERHKQLMLDWQKYYGMSFAKTLLWKFCFYLAV